MVMRRKFEVVQSDAKKDELAAEPKLFLTILEAKNLEFMQRIAARISVMIQAGGRDYSTTTATYAGDQATWINQKFMISIPSEVEPVVVNIIDAEE
mgnify:CR=1 FL=1